MEHNVATSGSDRSLTRLLLTTARELTAAIEGHLSDTGLGIDDWLVIATLATAPELTMTELRARTHISAPTLSRVTDRLVSRALVFREVDAADRRRVRLHLSKRGTELYRKLNPVIQAAEQDWTIENEDNLLVIGDAGRRQRA
ncbi:MarR family winged helix-turn-helix transcriptional regulator [Nocardia cyriacigeorgica]|uniref:MarR family transcriptional regulator n=1 Tax=Nocardia cyriacigeorgica TaxID=135487 RepID=A0A5R8NM97_9NOCA|nr:MarR family transcriptional regulator [Nocardia cyriacigeorgica]TLF76802.1 MarR family transcriptional regulator [Nocardia cyriacigeorgica]